MPGRQSFFEFISIGVGIARDGIVAFYKSFARRSRRPQRIDTRAEIENLAGIDADALRPVLDIPAMGSVN